MNATEFWLSQKIRRFESDCSQALLQINHARTLQDVVRAADVRVDSLIRFTGEVRHRQARVKHAAEEKAKGFVEDLAKRFDKADVDGRKALGREIHNALSSLQGNFPRLYQQLDRAIKTTQHR